MRNCRPEFAESRPPLRLRFQSLCSFLRVSLGEKLRCAYDSLAAPQVRGRIRTTRPASTPPV